MEEHVYLFVYGTLRTGGVAARLLRGCECLGPATARGTLYDIGGAYPAFTLDGDDTVQGEVWRCPAQLLARLDHYEGVAQDLFLRARVRIGERDCWTYVGGPRLAPQLTPDRRVVGGCWGS